jgi:hypothetical protein
MVIFVCIFFENILLYSEILKTEEQKMLKMFAPQSNKEENKNEKKKSAAQRERRLKIDVHRITQELRKLKLDTEMNIDSDEDMPQSARAFRGR